MVYGAIIRSLLFTVDRIVFIRHYLFALFFGYLNLILISWTVIFTIVISFKLLKYNYYFGIN